MSEQVSWPVLEAFEHAGLEVRIGVEEDVSMFDPRDHDGNLGVMVCWHGDYVLGDFQLKDDSGRGAVAHRFEPDTRGDGFRSMRHLCRYLELVDHARVVIPLYLYDHSGISMSAGAPNPFDNPRIRRDEFGTGLGWDSSMVGFIYTTPDRVAEVCGSADYKPDDEPDQTAWIVSLLRSEVDVYDQFLRGDVYWYSVGTEDDPYLDSVGGFFGFDHCKGEAILSAECAAKALKEAADRELKEARLWADRGVATAGGGA